MTLMCCGGLHRQTGGQIVLICPQGRTGAATPVASAHNDVVKSRRQKTEFRTLVRAALDQIKAIHGQGESLHVFPAMPVSLAVEAGRVRMPKADMPWIIYDQVDPRGAFVAALTLPEKGQ